MNRETYKILKRAHRNEIDETELKKIKLVSPIMKNRLRLILGEVDIHVDFSKVRQKFSKLENTPTYKDELVITYLLFLGKILNNLFLSHVFILPQSQAIFNWIALYKKIVYSIVVLMYNRKLTEEDWMDLDDMVCELNEGHFQSVRNFLNKLKVLTLSQEDVLDMEAKYDDIFSINSDDFGPFYWQMLHFMAEAMDVRKNAELAKTIWKEFTVYLLDRTLLCSICKHHYKESVIEKYKPELLKSSNYAHLWFEIHNQVSKAIQKLEYPKSRYEKDGQVIRDLLSPKK